MISGLPIHTVQAACIHNPCALYIPVLVQQGFCTLTTYFNGWILNFDSRLLKKKKFEKKIHWSSFLLQFNGIILIVQVAVNIQVDNHFYKGLWVILKSSSAQDPINAMFSNGDIWLIASLFFHAQESTTILNKSHIKWKTKSHLAILYCSNFFSNKITIVVLHCSEV